MSVCVTQIFSIILSNKVIRLDFLILERVDQCSYMINPLAILCLLQHAIYIKKKLLLIYFMLDGGENR